MRLVQVCLIVLASCFKFTIGQSPVALTGKFGSFNSPGYPNPYIPGSMVWFAHAREGYAYKVYFTSFDLFESPGCRSDFVLIDNEPLCGNLSTLEKEPTCPGQPKTNKEFESGFLFIRFVAGNVDNRNNIGFEAHYSEEDVNECKTMATSGGLICNQYCHNTPGSYYCSCLEGFRLTADKHTCEHEDGRTFSDETGEFPQSLPVKMDEICEETIVVKPGQTIEFEFESDFSIEEGCESNEEYGWLTLEGNLVNSSYTLCYNEGPQANCSEDIDREGLVLPEKVCPPLTTLITDDSNIQDSSNLLTSVGSIITFECKQWFTKDSGSFTWECTKDQTWVPVGSKSTPPHCVLDCGKRIPNNPGRIVGGRSSELGEWPWAALIAYGNTMPRGLESSIVCGGSLIKEQYVASAAHCHIGNGAPLEEIEIFLGVIHRSEERNRNNPNLQRFTVINAIIHPNFQQDLKFNHDIVIYKLHKKVNIARNVRPICLPITPDEKKLPLQGTKGYERSGPRYNGVVIGWGRTTDSNDLLLSDVLKMVSLPLIERNKCVKEFRKQNPDSPELGVSKNMFCAGYLNLTKDSCNGDSGGPLMWEDDTNRSFLNGIVSFGSQGTTCTNVDGFGVYTNVSNYIDFINAATDSILTCSYPHQLLNVSNSIAKISGFSMGSTITITCPEPFELNENKFYEWVCGEDRTWRANINRDARITNSEDLPSCTLSCGQKNSRVGKRAVGARDSFANEWPWMAFIDTGGNGLRLRSPSFCGGSLIHPQYVVSSARCTSLANTRVLFNRYIVFLGVIDRSERNSQEFDVIKLVVPSEYNENEYDNDIAVLKLDRSASLGDMVRPVCLPLTEEQKILPSTSEFHGAGIGWGRTASEKETSVLQLYRVPKIPNCQNHLNTQSLSQRNITFTSNMFCAGFTNVFRNFCTMDEGGPLMFRDSSRLWYLNGIASFTSLPDCHNRDTFGIYTDVSRYVDFITNTINQN